MKSTWDALVAMQTVEWSQMLKTLARAAWVLSLISLPSAGCRRGSEEGGASLPTGGAGSTSEDEPSGGSSGAAAKPASATGGATLKHTDDTDVTEDASTEVAACAAEDTPAEPVPLDIYLMLDISGSMLDPTQDSTAKWDAIKNALTSFLQDSGSEGISVGIQYFPLRKAGVPESCTSNEDCGAGGPCTLQRCTKYSTLIPNGIAVCESDADCAAIPTLADYGHCATGYCESDSTMSCTADADCLVAADFDYGPCEGIGHCELAPTVVCALNTACGPGIDGEDRGNCVTAGSGYCFHSTECDAAIYATPAVEIAAIPDATPDLVASLAEQVPAAETPSAPALRGAIDHARAWAQSHPNHTVVAVLATDGLPTECLPDDISFSGTRSADDLLSEVAGIAAEGVQGPLSIPTFVIGVFAGTDQAAPANLERIAQAGGTERAQMVDTGGDVSQQFLEALNAVRASRLQCEFLIPERSAGSSGKLDYFEVNVVYVDGDTRTNIPYVGQLDRCDPVQGGWYYDDGAGVAPTKILVCPSNCEAFQNSTGSIQIALGCETIIL
ncbi:MAG: VWA domain-containing protein [Polyangiaceae bacterium]|nr:VWA domain-containing protein [Polyangiaceae bacterium]